MGKLYYVVVGAVAVLWVFFCHEGHGGQAVRPRGVRPDLASFYMGPDHFECLDGSGKLGMDQVNDDYCDCTDGSDEPGTSACPAAQFYCPNLGYKPTTVFSSRVNDGICDCCDGSDEWALEKPCVNTCDELGRAERQEAERLALVVQEGLSVKAEMAKNGMELRHQRQQDLQAKQAERDLLKLDVDAKRTVKEEAESLERRALDAIREEEEKQRKIREENEKLVREAKAMEVFDGLDVDHDGQVTGEELSRQIYFDQNNDGVVEQDEVAFYLSGHDFYDKEGFLETGWPLMSHLFQNESDADTAANASESEYDYEDKVELERQNPEEDDDDSDDDADSAPDLASPDSQQQQQQQQQPPPPPPGPETPRYDEETQKLVDAANEARRVFDEADQLYRDLQQQVSELERHLQQDYGPDQEYAPLASSCYELTDAEYVYKLCAFDHCSQRQRSGASETRLGSWEKWSGPDGNHFAQMSFTHGTTCWNGPARSVKVNLQCGVSNQLLSVSEPSRCEYLFVFSTPAFCQRPASPGHDEL